MCVTRHALRHIDSQLFVSNADKHYTTNCSSTHDQNRQDNDFVVLCAGMRCCGIAQLYIPIHPAGLQYILRGLETYLADLPMHLLRYVHTTPHSLLLILFQNPATDFYC